jgi:HK97 family phage portal protein
MAKGKQKREKREKDAAAWMPGSFSISASSPDARPVTPLEAESLSAVSGCVQLVAASIATLPTCVHRVQEDGSRIEQPQHPVARMIRAPTPHMTWPDTLEWWLAQCLLHGNGLIGVEFDGAGRPVELVPIPWGSVVVYLLPNRRLAYDAMPYALGATMVPSRRWLQDEVLHLRDRSNDGFLGVARLNRAADAVGNSVALQEFTRGFWTDGMAPSGVLEHPKALNDAAKARLRADFSSYRGSRKRETLMLESGLTWKQISIAPEAAEVLASRAFSVSEIARIFQVPLILLSDAEAMRGTAAASAALQWFGMFCLSPWVAKIEAEFSRTLLTAPDVELNLDLSGLLRGDYATRTTAAVAMVGSGIQTPNEARAAEGLPPHPDGNVLRVMPGAPTPAGDMPKSPADAAAGLMDGKMMPNLKPNGAAA